MTDSFFLFKKTKKFSKLIQTVSLPLFDRQVQGIAEMFGRVVFVISLVVLGVGCWVGWQSRDCVGGMSGPEGPWRGKVVVITGASSGIGADLARTYSRMGARLVLAARREALLKAVRAECLGLGAASVETVAVDLGKREDAAELIHQVRLSHGLQLDALVLNHAVSDEMLFSEYKSENGAESGIDLMQDPLADIRQHAVKVTGEFERVMQINWLSLVTLLHLSMPSLLHSGGHVSFISSGSTLTPVPFHPAYISSKFAMNGLVSSLHEEFASLGIRGRVSLGVVIVGLIATPMVANKNSSALERTAMPSDACAAQIACTIHNREEWAYVPRYLGWVLPVFPLIPSFLRTLLVTDYYVSQVPIYVERIAKAISMLP